MTSGGGTSTPGLPGPGWWMGEDGQWHPPSDLSLTPPYPSGAAHNVVEPVPEGSKDFTHNHKRALLLAFTVILLAGAGGIAAALSGDSPARHSTWKLQVLSAHASATRMNFRLRIANRSSSSTGARCSIAMEDASLPRYIRKALHLPSSGTFGFASMTFSTVSAGTAVTVTKSVSITQPTPKSLNASLRQVRWATKCTAIATSALRAPSTTNLPDRTSPSTTRTTTAASHTTVITATSPTGRVVWRSGQPISTSHAYYCCFPPSPTGFNGSGSRGCSGGANAAGAIVGGYFLDGSRC